jgi:hypothetical protein
MCGMVLWLPVCWLAGQQKVALVLQQSLELYDRSAAVLLCVPMLHHQTVVVPVLSRHSAYCGCHWQPHHQHAWHQANLG